MQIVIVLHQQDPPSGSVAFGRGLPIEDAIDPGVSFMGWLGLLRALYQLVEPPGSDGGAD